MSWTEDSVLAASQMLAMTTVERDLVMVTVLYCVRL